MTNTFRLCTFNLLSPLYKRLPNKESQDLRESERSDLYVPRQKKCAKLVQETGSDVVCLQELWITKECISFFTDALTGYDYVYKKRTSFKKDGLAIFVNSKKLQIIDSQSIELNLTGYRVALLARVKFVEEPTSELIIVTTHLSFPHHERDHAIRLKQVQIILNWVNDYNKKSKLPVFFSGDFNLINDGVYKEMKNVENFSSAFEVLHSQEPEVTHFNHLAQQICVDFIFYKQFGGYHLSPIDALLYPKGVSHATFPKDFQLSDHRPLVSTIEVRVQNKIEEKIQEKI
ncbi:hypothetical protein M0813_23532 [Anaeramoeba flamelloides]|uniref:Endonuclease/exonuclease/phosphatase domain-containing protein n=1 Tax=Anaeramoeba flamelloides TaxID=1746091 RepID=A0ABQ8YAG9_9EUKA|nr:hypothetical protein M0813_23532 [Anaeramoeba flamelloides]